ncbi:MAG: PqqD family protein [Planctomycetota bacterium]
MTTAFETPAWLGPDADLACPTHSADVFEYDADDETVLLHRRTGESFRLNATAAVVWHRLAEPGTVGNVTAALTEAFDVDDDRARDDVLSLLSFWASHGLLADTPIDEPA